MTVRQCPLVDSPCGFGNINALVNMLLTSHVSICSGGANYVQ